MTQVALFEDHHWRNLLPMTLTRATFDIKVGARTYLEEYAHDASSSSKGEPAFLFVRSYLEKVTAERHGGCKVNPASVDAGTTIFVNGLVHPATIDLARLQGIAHTFAITHRGRLLVARLGKKDAEYLSRCVGAGRQVDLKKLGGVEKSTELKGEAEGVISDAWDIVRVLENSLAVQCAAQESSSRLNATVIGTATVVAEGAEIEDGVVLDARRGPIYVGPGASIAASRIVGPAYIGPETQVKQFSIIESSCIGRNCRVAGEIEHSIISDYSNKAHAGFVGHSYVGEWVNMGAMTTTSDLKMTYGDIKMTDLRGKKVDTGLNKIGSFFGDMCKTSIGTLVYSGGRIGACSHLHGLVAGDVPAFTIYGKSIGARNVELELASVIETQRKVMPRRGQSISKAYEQMIKDVFLMTAADRKRAGVRRAKFSL